MSVLRIVSAVSGPGVTMTIADTAKKAASSPTGEVSQLGGLASRRFFLDRGRLFLGLLRSTTERQRDHGGERRGDEHAEPPPEPADPAVPAERGVEREPSRPGHDQG